MNSAVAREWTAASDLHDLRCAGQFPVPELMHRAQLELVSIGSAPFVPAKSLRHYDSDTYGPFLGISNEGYGASLICEAAQRSPKARALGTGLNWLNAGVGVDGEVLGGIGEVPVGPEEYAQIWVNCVERTLMTTNVGARCNPRIFRAAPRVTVDLDAADGATTAIAALEAVFKPFRTAPGGPRPLLAYVEFAGGRTAQPDDLATLRAHFQKTPDQRLGLNVALGGGADDEAVLIDSIALAAAAGVYDVVVDGLPRRAAERAMSLPGLLNYFDRAATQRILNRATEAGVAIRPYNHLDAYTVARQTWVALNTARGFGLHLGKYGLVPLTLEESEVVVGHIQRWLGDWSAAPVCYVDRDLLTAERVYAGPTLAEGIALWLEMVARHEVSLVLIDTVDKAEGWKILKTGCDPKGLLTIDEIARLDTRGRELGIKVMWAGGIGADQARAFGELGVFGMYVTSAVSDRSRASGIYLDDPAIDATKHPNGEKIVALKSQIEAGFLAGRLQGVPGGQAADYCAAVIAAGQDVERLAALLPEVWQFWWSLQGAGGPTGDAKARHV